METTFIFLDVGTRIEYNFLGTRRVKGYFHLDANKTTLSFFKFAVDPSLPVSNCEHI